MNSKHSENNIVFFTFNSIKYVLPKYVINKMGIFNVINDVDHIEHLNI